MISIILPVFNSESTIKSTIESILLQKYNNYELIIVDDGSTDNTGDICKDFFYDKRIRYIKIKNYRGL